MASLMEELVATLEEEIEVYQNLIPVEQDKMRAVIANDMDSLQEITIREHDLVDRTSALEGKREKIVFDIATVLGLNPKTVKLTDIVEAIRKQPEDQKRLQDVHDRLRRTVLRLRDINNQNRDLLKESMDMIEYNMNVIRSTRMSSGSSNYSSDASEVYGMAPQHGLFDAKQ